MTGSSGLKSNPFATRFVAPGQLPWIAQDEDSTVAAIAHRFVHQCHQRAAIVGNHGAGKSTLLAHLVPTLGSVKLRVAAHEQREWPKLELGAGDVIWLGLRGQRASGQLLRAAFQQTSQSPVLWVIDGYEQLSIWMRLRLLRLTQMRRQGLLLTSHRPTWLPTLYRARMTLELAMATLERLVPAEYPGRTELLDEARVAQLLAKHHENLREVFMELYDVVG